MLIESTVHLPISLAMLEGILKVFKKPEGIELAKISMRWLHFVGGITWIGLLYFFNLVNVPFQKGLDAETKKKINPDLLSRTLWYFRWGAVLTVLTGLGYYVMYILKPDVQLAHQKGAQFSGKWLVFAWLTYPIALFLIEYLIIKKVPVLTQDGRVYAVVMFILVGVVSFGLLKFFNAKLIDLHGQINKTLSIGVGGAYGILMMLNVWGIIWPNNKRSIAAFAGTGPAAPPELARQAFLASRTNAWLSLPLLLLMATSHGDWIIFGGG